MTRPAPPATAEVSPALPEPATDPHRRRVRIEAARRLLTRSIWTLTFAEWRAIGRAQRALIAAEWHVRTRPIGGLLGAVAPDGARWTGGVPDAEPREPVATPDTGASVPRIAGRRLDRSDARRAWDVAVAVHRAARYGPFRPRCLTRSIALQRLLVRQGLLADIRVGVRRTSGGLVAHAWVELDGHVVGDEAEHVRRYAQLADFRAAP